MSYILKLKIQMFLGVPTEFFPYGLQV